MKTEKNIFIAFLLNLAFSIFELFGGILSGSIAIISDAVHDAGDALSIGASYFLEKKSKKKPDENYSYGYARYSVLGSVITTLILIFGSVAVILGAISRIISPSEINYNGMIIFAVAGTVINGGAVFFTKDGSSLNERAVNLHMLEDSLGWIAVLIGAIVMKFTNLVIIDPIISIAVALFIFVNAIKNIKTALNIFLEKVPGGIYISKIREHLLNISGVIDVHHVHVWTLDGQTNCATLHVLTDAEPSGIKEKVRGELRNHGIHHATVELEFGDEHCHEKECLIEFNEVSHLHCHHH